MKLEALPKTTKGKKKRLGRGYGSGQGGHTVGRGAKGAKARGKVGLTFTGTKIKKSLFKRLPLRRGKGKFKPLKTSPVIVNLKHLAFLPKGTVVDAQLLAKEGIIDRQEAAAFGVKVLGEGSLDKPLTVALPVSKSAAAKIEKAGGKVVSAPVVAEEKEIKEAKPEVEKKVEKKAERIKRKVPKAK